jgi:hypothetical protein
VQKLAARRAEHQNQGADRHFLPKTQGKHVTAECKLVNHLSWMEGIQLRRAVKLVLTPSDPYKPAPVAARTGNAAASAGAAPARTRTHTQGA